jgi:hypothetical protein
VGTTRTGCDRRLPGPPQVDHGQRARLIYGRLHGGAALRLPHLARRIQPAAVRRNGHADRRLTERDAAHVVRAAEARAKRLPEVEHDCPVGVFERHERELPVRRDRHLDLAVVQGAATRSTKRAQHRPRSAPFGAGHAYHHRAAAGRGQQVPAVGCDGQAGGGSADGDRSHHRRCQRPAGPQDSDAAGYGDEGPPSLRCRRDPERRARHQVVVVPLVPCACGTGRDGRGGDGQRQAALWQLTRAGWRAVRGVAASRVRSVRCGPRAATPVLTGRAEETEAVTHCPHGRSTPARSPSRPCPWWRLPS